MKIQLEPHGDYVSVTIENDEDARKFWELGADIICKDAPNDAAKRVREIYDGYANQQVRENTVHIDRHLWDYWPDSSIGTFGCQMLKLLGII